MVYENTGGVPNVMTYTGRGGEGYGDYGHQSWWWVFALVLIFLALIFLWGRGHDRRNGLEDIIPALALSNGIGKKNDGCCCEHRDLLKETGHLQKEIMQTAWQNDKSVLENRFLASLGFKEQEVLGLKNTSEIMNRICMLENNLREDKLRATEMKLNNLETIVGIRGLGLIPAHAYASYPVNPPHCSPSFA